MKAMVLERPGKSLELRETPDPLPLRHQVRVKVQACGICRTDLHVVDGELTSPKLPLIPGHQVVGKVDLTGPGAKRFKAGDIVGVPWLGGSCRICAHCLSGRENLCDGAIYTGYQRDGGFAEYCLADERYIFPVPAGYPPLQAAPLFCAGLIGYRAYRMLGLAHRIGFYGFGAAAHLLTQVALYQGRQVYAFTRPEDEDSQAFARRLGASWAGSSDERPPHRLDGAIIFAPVGNLVPMALKAVDKGGKVVCAGIHMSDIPSFPYSLLWGERSLLSVANLTRLDGEEFLALAPRIPVTCTVTIYSLEQVNQALADLRGGRLQGAAVVKIAD